MQRAILMTLCATGVRRAELCRLKVADIDGERIVLHTHQGKGGRDRDVPLSRTLLSNLREYRLNYQIAERPRLAGPLVVRARI